VTGEQFAYLAEGIARLQYYAVSLEFAIVLFSGSEISGVIRLA